MAALGSQSIASSYEQLLHVDADGGGNSTTHVSVKDGDNGTTFALTLATDAVMITSDNRLEFGDTGTYIHQSANGVLDLVSDTEIEINATTIDVNGAVDMSSTLAVGDNITATSSTSLKPVLKLDNTNTDANPSSLVFDKSVTGANDDILGRIDFTGQDTGNGETTFARIDGLIQKANATAESGKLVFQVAVDNTMTEFMRILGGSGAGGVSEVIFNEGSEDHDFRVESASNANAIFLDGATGAVTMAEQPAFSGKPNAIQSNIAINTLTQIVMDVEIYDQGGDFASNIFTAPVTGKYQLSCALRVDQIDIDADYVELQLVTSNRTYSMTILDPDGLDSNPAYWHMGASILADMDASDTAQLKIFQGAGAAEMDIATDSFFTGYLAC